MKIPDRRKWGHAALLFACAVFVSALMWYDSAPGIGMRHPGVVTGINLLILLALNASGVLPPTPYGIKLPLFGIIPKLFDVLKAAGCVLLSFLWTPIGLHLMPDTLLGVTLILGPDLILCIAALVFISNSLSH